MGVQGGFQILYLLSFMGDWSFIKIWCLPIGLANIALFLLIGFSRFCSTLSFRFGSVS